VTKCAVNIIYIRCIFALSYNSSLVTYLVLAGKTVALHVCRFNEFSA